MPRIGRGRPVADYRPIHSTITSHGGYSYIYDSAPAGDTLGQQGVESRTLAESTSASDGTTRAGLNPRSDSQSAAASDSIAFFTGVQISEIASATDVSTVTIRTAQSISDSAVAGDGLTRHAVTARSVATDAAPAVDSLHVLGYLVHEPDSAAAADTISRQARNPRTVGDSAAGGDAVHWFYPRAATDNAPAVESIYTNFTPIRTVADSAPAAELYGVASRVQAASLSESPGLYAGDYITQRIWRASRSFADSATAYDIAGRRARAPYDTAYAVDAVLLPAGRLASLVRTASTESAPAVDTTSPPSTRGLLRSLHESASTTDLATRAAQAFTRPDSVTASASDDASPSMVHGRTVAESSFASDTVTRLAHPEPVLTDAATASDDVVRALVTARPAADAALAADDLVRTVLASRPPPSESAPAGDVYTRHVSTVRPAPEAIGGNDHLPYGFATASDLAGASDNVTRQVVLLWIAPVESDAATDAVTARLVKLVGPVGDSASAGDLSLTRVMGLARVLGDVDATTDAATRRLLAPRPLPESASADDTIGAPQRATRTLSDAASALDSTTARHVALVAPVPDSAPALDTVTRQYQPAPEYALAVDSISFPAGRLVSLGRAAAEPAPAVDAVVRSLRQTRPVAESALALDAVVRSLRQTRPIADSAPVVESYGGAISGQAFESAPAADIVTHACLHSRVAAESAPAVDLLGEAAAGPRTVAESAPAADTAVRHVVDNRQAVETAIATDAVAPRSVHFVQHVAELGPPDVDGAVTSPQSFTRSAAGDAAAGDQVERVELNPRRLIDNNEILDSVTRHPLSPTRPIGELAGADDSINSPGGYTRAAAESAPAVDVATIGYHASFYEAGFAADSTSRHLEATGRAADLAPATDGVEWSKVKFRAVPETALASDTSAAPLLLRAAIFSATLAGDAWGSSLLDTGYSATGDTGWDTDYSPGSRYGAQLSDPLWGTSISATWTTELLEPEWTIVFETEAALWRG